MNRLVMFLAATERARAAKDSKQTLDIEAEAKQHLLFYPGLDVTVEEVSAILRDELAAA